jgi:hypothetical protein
MFHGPARHNIAHSTRASASRSLAAVVALVALGCESSPVLQDDYFTDDATVQGRVTDLAGKPLSAVSVRISIGPSASPFSYQPAFVDTDSLGHFQVVVYRVGRNTPAPKPDTLTAQLIATASGPQYTPLPGGGFRSDSVPVFLQFVPHRTQGPVGTVAIRLVNP